MARLLALVLLFPLWRLSAAPAVPPLTIGLLAIPGDPNVQSLRQGAALGMEHANQLPGTPGVLVTRGRPGQWGTDGDEAAALALDEQAAAMIAPASGEASHQVMQIAGRTRVPVVTLCPDSSVSGTGIPWVIRIVPRSDLQAQTILSGLNDHGRKPLHWVALVPQGRPGREAASDLLRAGKASGSPAAETLSVPPKTAEWAPVITKLLSTNPSVALLWLDADIAGKMAGVLRQSGYRGLLAGPAPLHSPAFLANAGAAAEGFIIPSFQLTAEQTAAPEYKKFYEGYRKQFGAEPDFTAGVAYDSALLLMSVLRQAGQEPPYRSFPLAGKFPGAFGPVSFDKDGNRLAPLTLLQCNGRRFGAFTSSNACPVNPTSQ